MIIQESLNPIQIFTFTTRLWQMSSRRKSFDCDDQSPSILQTSAIAANGMYTLLNPHSLILSISVETNDLPNVYLAFLQLQPKFVISVFILIYEATIIFTVTLKARPQTLT